MKRIFVILLTFVLLLGICPMSALAETGGSGNVDGGGGDMGQGTSQNSWNPGMDGVRITVVDAESGQPVSSSFDLTNKTPSIIYDCGVMQTPTSIFRDADHRLLCGSVLPYEIPVFHKALSECGSLEVRPVAICVPQEIQEYCMELFGENVQIAAASHDLFAKRVNGQIYRPLVEKYIAGEKRL